MEKGLKKFIERDIISKDKEFFEEVVSLKGLVTNNAERQAWLDWASEMISYRLGVDMQEGESIAVLIESYSKEYEII